MTFTFEKNNSVGILKLYGDFTARNASNVKKAFFVGLSNSEHLVLDLQGVSKIDDYFADQIFSLKKISTRHKKRLTIFNLHPAVFHKKEELKIDGKENGHNSRPAEDVGNGILTGKQNITRYARENFPATPTARKILPT